jgi:Family of unknown function (DUF5701)
VRIDVKRASPGDVCAGTTAGGEEFDRQVATLLERGYPAAAGLSEPAFTARLVRLRAAAERLDGASDPASGSARFVIVVRGALVPAAAAIALVRRRGRAGFLAMLTRAELETFAPIEPVELPGGAAYLIRDVDNGAASRNVTPDDARADP